MDRKKLLISIITTLVMSIMLIGCVNKKVENRAEINLFNQKKALDVAKNYLEYIQDGDLESAQKLYTEELASKNKDTNLGESKINSFITEDLIESGDGAYVIFDVVRSLGTGPQCDLDNIIIKVVKIESEYKIEGVSAKNTAHIFEQNDSLRMVEENGSKSDLIITLSNMPKDVYIKDGKVMLNKEIAVNKEFGRVALSYTGEKIAITTKGDSGVFICSADIERSKETQGSVTDSDSEDIKGDNIKDLLDKPIAQKITPIDIIKDIEINNISFSELENELIVEYSEKLGYKRVNIYKVSDGEKLDLKLDEIFPKEKYDLSLKGLEKKIVFIDVSVRAGATGVRNEVLGKYKIDLNKLSITKI